MADKKIKQDKFKQDASRSNYYTVLARDTIIAMLVFLVPAIIFLVMYLATNYFAGRIVFLVLSIVFASFSSIAFLAWLLNIRTKAKMLQQGENNEATVREIIFKRNKVSIHFVYRDRSGLDYFGFREPVKVSDKDLMLLRTFEKIPIIHMSHVSATREFDLKLMLDTARERAKSMIIKNGAVGKLSANQCPYCTSIIVFDDGQEGFCQHCGTTFTRLVRKN